MISNALSKNTVFLTILVFLAQSILILEEHDKGICLCNLIRLTQLNEQETVIEGEMKRVSVTCLFFRFQCTTNLLRTYIQVSELGLA